MQPSRQPCWSTLPDGLCEHVASFLPRIAQLACRLVCRAWQRSFAHSLTALTLDTRLFGAPDLNPLPTGASAPDADVPTPAPTGSLPPSWRALVNAIGPALRCITVRVSLFHESKARAVPSVAAAAACLRYLALLHRYDQCQLQLILPLRCALPPELTDTLSSALGRLRSLRVVRCCLTQQAAAALGGMTQLRSLCLAHASLAALPQLLEASPHLEHIHVHGYHSLVIMDENPHMRAVWGAASELVERSLEDRGPGTPAAGDGRAGGSSGPGSGRLQCLAVSAHYLYHDAVLDDSELDFEAEAVQWQILFEGSASGDGTDGALQWCGDAGRVSGRAAVFGGCYHDPHEDPPGLTGGSLRTYAGSGSGGSALCAAALVGLRCLCCCPAAAAGVAGGGGGHLPRSSSSASTPAAARTTTIASASPTTDADPTSHQHETPRGGAAAGAIHTSVVAAPPAPMPPAAAPGSEARQGSSVSAATRRTAAEVAGLRLRRSAKRCVQLWPPAQLLAEIARPPWRHLQYAQLEIVPGPATAEAPLPPPPPPPALLPRRRLQRRMAVGPNASDGADADADVDVSGMGPMSDREDGPGMLGEPLTHGSPVASSGDVQGGDAAGPDCLQLPTLEALNGLPALRGIWLDPGEGGGEELVFEQWEDHADEEDCVREEDGDGNGGVLAHPAVTAAAAETAGMSQGAGTSSASGPSSADVVNGSHGGGDGGASHRRRCRWVRLGDVWTRLYEPPSRPVGVAAAAAGAITAGALVPVLDAAPHAALLAPVTSLRSLALGRRRLAQPPKLVLGVGDDAAELLARLSGLTKLHLFAAYTLPLYDEDETRSMPYNGQAAAVLPPPLPRLAALGSLTDLQRLALHFRNPLRRPAVIAHAALPTSLTSLSLHGVVLEPPAPAAAGGCSCDVCGALQRTPAPRTEVAATAVAAAAGAATATAARGGSCAAAHRGPLERLRELSLSSSYIGGADLLGCGHRLRILSLQDSGLALAARRGTTAAKAGDGISGPPLLPYLYGDLAALLRTWHGVQTLRVQGTTSTSKDVQLPAAAADRCLSWLSPAGLRAIATCLPGLRQLHLALPSPPPPSPPPPYGTAVAAAAACTGGAMGAMPAPQQHLLTVPYWRLTSSGGGGRGGGGGSSSSTPGIGFPTEPARMQTAEADSPDQSEIALPGPGGARSELSPYGSETEVASTGTGSETDSESGDDESLINEEAVDGGVAPRAPRLAPLLRLLCCRTPHLQVLRLNATLPDWSAGEAAVRCVLRLLPTGLPALDALGLLLDLGLPYLLAQPQPEAAAREWAERLRVVEVELQARMRPTCIEVTPHPLLMGRVREAVRALALQSTCHRGY